MNVFRTFALLGWLSLAMLLTGCSYRYRQVWFPEGTSGPTADQVFARIKAALRSPDHLADARAAFPFLEERHWQLTGVELVLNTDSAGNSRYYVSVFVSDADKFPQVDAFLAFRRARVQSEMREALAQAKDHSPGAEEARLGN